MGSLLPLPIAQPARRIWRASGLRDLRLRSHYRQTRLDWQGIRRTLDGETVQEHRSLSAGNPRILIIPPDPLLLTASKGDEAMLGSLIAEIRSRYSDPTLHVGTCSDVADQAAGRLDVEPARILEAHRLHALFAEISRLRPTHVITLGADVLDGSYDPNFSLRHIALTDLASRSGARAAVMGFSFSGKPFPALRQALDTVSKDVTFYLRDGLSYERFTQFSSAKAEPTADLAFLMPPADRIPEDVEQWIVQGREAGRKTIGVNFHPLLFSHQSRVTADAAIHSLATVLAKLVREQRARILLLCHDFRGTSADRWCLDRVFDMIRDELGQSVYYLSRELPAPQLKAIVGHLDAVFSGRMHLAIASLGMGVPVLGFKYKDKFEGLFRHFSIPSKFLMSNTAVADSEAFYNIASEFLENCENLSRSVGNSRPSVLDLARRNFKILESSD